MTEKKRTAAIVGTTGGAGATRLSVELGATLARADHDVAVLDAAFATQGLSRYVSGRIDPDVTALLTTDEYALDDALFDPFDAPGRLALCPAYAPFERLARAKTPDAAQRFGDLLTAAADEFDHVLVDTPSIATNPAVAAVTEADLVALVAPDSARGADAVQATHGRLADVGTDADHVIANRRTDSHPVAGADVSIPEYDSLDGPAPACLSPDPAFAPSVAAAAERLFDVSLALEFPEERLLDVDQYVPASLS